MPKTLMIIGGVVLAIGVLTHFLPNAFSWFGRLPGDIRIENENSKIYFPITTMIIVSIVLSLLSKVFTR
ncbi:MAG: DUF2905 domain-containing protein [Lentisphaeraceae bacterium]|nr:DUF2905 domain-containing protein [Lentisphaeraceae bacterium]